ncbi:MAG: hypothetical protein CMJ81_14160 [Planctomycetaceae bacterium]|nr:hypothetical protein [Planctomycetaceae bacterium]
MRLCTQVGAVTALSRFLSMHENYWKLKQSPFGSSVDPKHFFNSSTHEEGLARLRFLVDQQRSLGLLLGPRGCGKSLLLEVLARDLRCAGHFVCQVNLLGMCAHELLWSVANQFSLFPKTDDSTLHLWKLITDRLATNHYQQLSTVILLDDADEAIGDTLLQVLRIAKQETTPQSRTSIILSAEAKRQNLLGSQLLDLAELRIELEPWSTQDTEDYLQQASVGGNRAGMLFDAEATQTLHVLSGGVPRRINQLAKLCLLAGAGRELPHIDATTVENVFHELDIRA